MKIYDVKMRRKTGHFINKYDNDQELTVSVQETPAIPPPTTTYG